MYDQSQKLLNLYRKGTINKEELIKLLEKDNWGTLEIYHLVKGLEEEIGIK